MLLQKGKWINDLTDADLTTLPPSIPDSRTGDLPPFDNNNTCYNNNYNNNNN